MSTSPVLQAPPVRSRAHVLVECALLCAVGTVLARFQLYRLPNGGSITLVSMLPFILLSLRNGAKWGLLAGMVNALLQMLLDGIPAAPAGTLSAFLAMIALDYLLGFGVLGLAQAFARPFGRGHRLTGVVAGTLAVCILRFLCSFLSGFLIWGSVVTDGVGAVWYSLGYNASYMIPETVLTLTVAAILYHAAPRLYDRMA